MSDQAHQTATDIWNGVNDALEKYAPERSRCLLPSARDMIAKNLRLTFAHIEARAVKKIVDERDELLEALKSILNTEHGDGGYSEDEIAAFAKARAAIAKAEGKEGN